MSDTESMPPPRRTSAGNIPPPRNRPSSSPPPNQNESLSSREKTVIELLEIPKIPFALIASAQQIREPEAISPFLMDMYAIDAYKAPIAKSIVKFADSNPVLGVILDRLGAVSPVAEIVAAGFGLLMQIAENHRRLPEGIAEHVPGLMSHHDLAVQVRQDIQAKMAETNGN